jgi:hypothetical protein
MCLERCQSVGKTWVMCQPPRDSHQAAGGLWRVHLPRLPIPVMAPKRSASTSPEPSTLSSDARSDSSSDGERLPAQQTTRSGRTSRPPNRHVPSPGKLHSDTNEAYAARLYAARLYALFVQQAQQFVDTRLALWLLEPPSLSQTFPPGWIRSAPTVEGQATGDRPPPASVRRPVVGAAEALQRSWGRWSSTATLASSLS